MAKIDSSRNYYADLSIPANASDNDIRKSFRKLALECHPDRHPGQEQEWVAKFQQIQAAHEILSDPQQRAKYDQERRKYRNLHIPPYHPPNTPRSRPPPPPRNAYTSTPNGGQYYRPPPPKPQPQPQPQPFAQRPPPPQHNSTFTNGADRFTSNNFRRPPTAPKPTSQKDADARANVFSAWQKMKQPRAEQPKTYNPNNPYNPNGVPFGRSQSTRMPSSSKKGFDPGSAGADEGQARSAYRSNYERPKASPLDEEAAQDVPFAEANRVRTPYASTKSGERTSMFGDGVGRSASVRNSPTNPYRPGSSADPGFHSDSGHRPQRASYGGPAKDNPFPHMYVSSSDEEEDVRSSQGKKSRAPPPPRESPQQQPSSGQGIFGSQQQNFYQANGSSPNPFKSKSEESINMKFSPSDWSGTFQGKPDYFIPNPQKGSTGKGRMSPSRGRSTQRTATEKKPVAGQSQPPPPVSSFAQSQSSQMPPPPPLFTQPLNTQTEFPSGSASAPHTAKFEPGDWAETFKEPSWAYPNPAQTKETSPRRASAAPKRPNPARKGSVAPEGGSNAEGQSERKAKYQAFAEDVGGDAMDVDSDYEPPTEKPKPATASAPVASRTRAKATGTVAASNGAAASVSSADKPSAPGLSGLAGLGNVEPFLPPTNQGLGLDGLKDALPFKSEASHNHPTKPNTAQKLKYPEVPLAPNVPQKLDPASTQDYLSRMDSYVKQYRVWNQNMLSHFAARNEELQDLDDRFVQQRGETTRKIGFPGYLSRMKEDEKILETWRLGQEMHISAMMKCQDVRNKTMKQYLHTG
ncbi:hypothetical protein N0V90_007196 [Kalmusia sp. IMI 367209]|nr:hypothetical protein N0V90_007196 [Kalmusia sp. IMI 367209]